MALAVARPSRIWAVISLLRLVPVGRNRWGRGRCRTVRPGAGGGWTPSPARPRSILLEGGVQGLGVGERRGAAAQRGDIGPTGQGEGDDVGDLGELLGAETAGGP